MKIGKERIKGFVMKPLASGTMYYGWEPSPAERKAGWKSMKIEAEDLGRAIEAARKRNEEVVNWREGGAKPAAVKRYNAPQTWGAVLDRYEREKLPALAANSRRVDQTQLNLLREWAGKHPLAWITRARVRKLRNEVCPQADAVPGLIREGVRDIPGHNPAFKLLSKGREVWSWWNDHPENGRSVANPFERFGLPKPPARDQLWDYDAEVAFVASAGTLGWHSIGFALELANVWGQREADILNVRAANWREVTLAELDMQRDLHAALASPTGPDAGKAMGFGIVQRKTRARNAVPIAGEMRERVELLIAAARKRVLACKAAGQVVPIGATNLIVRDFTGDKWRGRDMTGEPWSQRDFIEKFGIIRAHAAAQAREQGNEDLAERLEGLEFRDARRTCVTRLANLGMSVPTIAAVTGHSIKTVERIIETYLVRTAAQAGRGMVALLGAARDRKERKESQA